MNIHFGILLLNLFSFTAYSQSTEIELTQGTWDFCVNYTHFPPYRCEEEYTYAIYKFKKSGRFIQHRVDNNKKVTKKKGNWELSGNALTIDIDDSKNSMTLPKTIDFTIIDGDTFYSPQPDVKTVYWLFTRNVKSK